jgi:hypothetical protein
MPTRTLGLDWGIAANQIAASAGHHSSARSTLMPNRARVDRGVTRRSGCGICTNTWYPRPLPRKRAIRVFLQVGSLTCEPARAVVTGEAVRVVAASALVPVAITTAWDTTRRFTLALQ